MSGDLLELLAGYRFSAKRDPDDARFMVIKIRAPMAGTENMEEDDHEGGDAAVSMLAFCQSVVDIVKSQAHAPLDVLRGATKP